MKSRDKGRDGKRKRPKKDVKDKKRQTAPSLLPPSPV